MSKIDVLNRQEFVDQLVALTENIAKGKRNATFAIDGLWGTGKSFVLELYENKLEQIQTEETFSDKYFVIHYNCWQYDYYEEPLVAIVAAMVDIINEKTKLWNDEEKKAKVLEILKSAGVALLSMVNTGAKEKLGVDLKRVFEILQNGVREGQETYEKSKEYDIYFSFKQALKSLKNLLEELSEIQTVVFVVDELDRCLPEYAVKVLERLHHLTEQTTNVLTILAIDKTNLEKSIQQIFGFDSPKKYLEKFIDFEITLGSGTISEEITQKYADYIELFDKDVYPFEDSLEEYCQEIFNGIEVRTQEHIVQKTKTIHQLLYSDKKDYTFMCMELLLAVLIVEYGHSVSGIESTQLQKDWESSFVCGKKTPPFVSFFKEHFDFTSFSYDLFNPNSKIHTIQLDPPKLYPVILFYWYWLHQRNNDYIIQCYDISNDQRYSSMKNNVEELKRFIHTISMIK